MTSTPFHLILPREEAMRLKEAGNARLLYPIKELLASPGFRLSSNTAEQFPARTKLTELPENPAAPWVTQESSHEWVDVLNAGRLWNFLGDGTHATSLLQVPFGLIVGQELTVENRYNVAPLSTKVKSIELLRLQSDLTWYWLIELTAHMG